jgi:hypothetical protein
MEWKKPALNKKVPISLLQSSHQKYGEMLAPKMAYCRWCPLLFHTSSRAGIKRSSTNSGRSTLFPIFEHQDLFPVWSYGKHRKDGHAPCGTLWSIQHIPVEVQLGFGRNTDCRHRNFGGQTLVSNCESMIFVFQGLSAVGSAAMH